MKIENLTLIHFTLYKFTIDPSHTAVKPSLTINDQIGAKKYTTGLKKKKYFDRLTVCKKIVREQQGKFLWILPIICRIIIFNPEKIGPFFLEQFFYILYISVHHFNNNNFA
jgi:hypothetical protein